MITRLYIIRHANSIGNEKGLFGGITDYDLSSLGYDEANKLVFKIKDLKVDKIYSSPLKRAYLTIKPYAEYKNLDINIENDLHEINLGEWENLPISDLVRDYSDSIDKMKDNHYYHDIPGQERIEDVADRMYNAIINICKNNEGKNIILVTHSVALRSFLCKIGNIPFNEANRVPELKNTCLTIVEYEDGKFNIIGIGE